MDSAPTTPNPEDEVSRHKSVQAASPATGRSRFGRILSALAPILLGGGSVFGVVQWAVTGPQYESEIRALQAEKAQLENKAAQQKLDLDNALKDLTVAEQHRAVLSKFHVEELASLRRELASLRWEKTAYKATRTKEIEGEMEISEIAFRQRLKLVQDSAFFLQVDVRTSAPIDRRQNRH